MFRIASICALAMAFAIAGCGHRITPAHAKHMVCADSTGQPCDGTDGYAPMDQNRLYRIFRGYDNPRHGSRLSPPQKNMIAMPNVSAWR